LFSKTDSKIKLVRHLLTT